jgi:1-acyl-sn-glycerol-3-phosphate acyltransferase
VNTLLNSQIWLALLATCAVAYSLRIYLRQEYSTWEIILYLPAYLLGRLLWRVQFTNQPPPEMRSGAVLAPNHRSSVDPMFIQLAAKRRVHWMVAKEYCSLPVLRWILKSLQVIPTNRTGTDINSTKLAMHYTRRGGLVGMFPEGRINFTMAPLLPIRAGAAMVALKTGVPIIPLYVEGSPYRGSVISPLITPARVLVTFGQPIATSSVHPQSTTQVPAETSSTDSDETSLNQADRAGNSHQLAAEIMVQWGRTMVALAGQPHASFTVGSARKRTTQPAR